MLAAAIFTQTGFSFKEYGCYIDKVLPYGPPYSPYQRQVICTTTEKDNNNGTIISETRVTLWCYGGTAYWGGAASGTCIVYNLGGKETAVSEPAETQDASPGLSSNLGTVNESKGIGNDFAATNDNPPVSDSKENPSKDTDTSQLKQLIPIGPPDSATSDKGDSGNSDDKDTKDTNQEANKDAENKADNNANDNPDKSLPPE
jgi:hypothetical protein